MLVKGHFNDFLNSSITRVDTCGKVRHFFANLHLCRHKYETVGGLKGLFERAYKELPK